MPNENEVNGTDTVAESGEQATITEGNALEQTTETTTEQVGEPEVKEEKKDEPVVSEDELKAQAAKKKEDNRFRAIKNDLRKEREERIRLDERIKVLQETGAVPKPGTASSPAPSDQRPVRPRIGDFQDQESYEAAVDAYEEKRDSWRESQVERKVKTNTAESEWNNRTASIISKGEETYNDFSEVTHKDNLRLTPAMALAVVEMGDEAHHVEYYLGTHQDEADKIAKMSPVRQAIEIGKLTDRMVAERKASPKPRESAAPAPIKPVKSGSTVQVDESKLSDAEWYAKHKKEKLTSA